MKYVIYWLLIGSLLTNLLWIIRSYIHKSACKPTQLRHYFKGLSFGLILGPLVALPVCHLLYVAWPALKTVFNDKERL